MFKILCSTDAARRRHLEAPFARERATYLQSCADSGATYGTLRVKSTELLWLAQQLGPPASLGVDIARLKEVARERTTTCKGASAARRVIDIGRPWLRFLGWWRVREVKFQFQDELDRYVAFMRDERGLSPATIEQWRVQVRMFLQWLALTNRQLSALKPSDVDHYFIVEGAQRWSRCSASNIATTLRVFLRHTASQGACDPRLAEAICRPRIYAQESLPYAPSWTDVRRMLTENISGKPRDVRDHAILLLLAVYGMRRGEVAALKLDQVDWCSRVLRVFRLKRRQPQAYPLLPSVAEALSRYIDTVRPRTSHQEIFIRMQSPWRPISAAAIYEVARRRFDALGIQTAHRGPHALRHACAARLVADGLTLKEIGDHLGHRSTSSTRTYAKVDLSSLRQVGDFDLGEVQ